MACRCPQGSVRKGTRGRGRGFVCISTTPRTKRKRVSGATLTYTWHPFVAAIGCGRRATKKRGKKRRR